MPGLWGDATDPYTAQPQRPGGLFGDASDWLYNLLYPTQMPPGPQMPGARPAEHPDQTVYQSSNQAPGAVELSTVKPGMSPDEAASALYGMTGIPDMQQGYQALKRGEYLQAIGQGGYGAANLASLALPAARGALSVGREGAPLMREALSAFPELMTDESGALSLAARRRLEIPIERPLPPDVPAAEPPVPAGHNLPPEPTEAAPVTEPPASSIVDPEAPATGATPPRRFSTPGLLGSNPLPIPNDAEVRAARKAARTNPNIGAPKNPEAIQLPDTTGPNGETIPGIHLGPVDVNQWIARNESLMSGDEIDKAAKWYQEALPAYQERFGDKAPAMMGAWLMANQNATPGFAQLSATRALEQYINKTAGMPESATPGLAADKLGMWWDAIQSGDMSKLPQSGQKIYDFIDSAAGKNTRTFYGDDPAAGAPAVADVHTGRDTGVVDPTLHDWIAKKYGDRVAAQFQVDPGSSPSESQYEWQADRVRQWTDQLNQMKYRGRDDWTPDQVQAVGWMGMSKLLGRPGMTAESSIQSIERRLSYEMDFGKGAPFNTQFPDWQTLTPQEKATVQTPILNQIMDFAKDVTGAQEDWRLHGTGAWRADLNPAVRSQFLSSPEVAHDVANIIGYLGQQTAVYGSRFVPSGKDFTLAVHGPGLDDPATLRNLWQEVYTAHPDLVGGFSPAQDANGVPGIHIGFEGAGKKLQARIENELSPTIEKAAQRLGLNIEGKLYRGENIEPTNDWEQNPDGGLHLQRLSARYGPSIQQRLDDFSQSTVQPALRRGIEEALRARGEAATGPPGTTASGAKKTLGGLAVGGGLLAPAAAYQQQNSPGTPPGLLSY